MGPRARRVVLGSLLLLLVAGALWPAPATDALVLQGLERLLSRATAGAASDPESLFGAIRAAGGEGAPVHVQVSLDAAPLTDAAVRRVVRAHLNRYRAATVAPDPSKPAVKAELMLERTHAGLQGRLRAAGAPGMSGVATLGTWRVPGRSALLPPLVAIVMALLTQRTLLALFAGVFTGATWLAADSVGVLWAPLRGLFDVIAVYLRAEVLDRFRIEIIGFIVALIGMMGVMSRAGGVQGLVDRLLEFARTLRASLLLTFGMGLALFFDDYANCMLVGNTMRPLTDRFRVSREKLAYLVDSTAAPVAGISLFSTWIAFQVSVYEPQLPSVGIEASGYEIFLRSLPYRFYSLLTLIFVGFVVVLGRDFGPMARAEARARAGALVRPGGRAAVSDAEARMAAALPPDWRRAAFPLCVTAAATAVWILASGGGFMRLAGGEALSVELLTAVLFDGSGPQSIFAGALVGFGLACAMAGSNVTRLVVGIAGLAACAAVALLELPPLSPVLVGVGSFALIAVLLAPLAAAVSGPTSRPYLALAELARASFASTGTLGFAIALLFLAWMIGAVCEDLGTADYLVALLGDALPAPVLPVLLFAVACVVAFATGSSWSTMSILLPNVVGLAGALGASSGLGTELMVVLCVSAVLEGSIFGDHCSPISDTTVLSSVAAGSDHIDHVKTQAPYAISVAIVALLLGYLPVVLLPSWSPIASLAVGAGLLFLLIRGLGRPLPPAHLAAAVNLE